MAISHSDMSFFISQILEKRYEVALQNLQSMLSTSEPERYSLARKEALAMVCVIAASLCSKAIIDVKSPDADDKFRLLQFFIACYAVTGDARKQLVSRYDMLTLHQSMFTPCHDPNSVVDLEDWITFARDCVQGGFYANGVKAFDKIAQCAGVESSDLGAYRSSNNGGQSKGERKLVSEAAHEKYLAMRLGNRRPVQVQALELLKSKTTTYAACKKERPYSDATATDRYLIGIKKRNQDRLKRSQKDQTNYRL